MNEYGLPEEVVYLGHTICDTIDEFMDEDVIADVVSDKLSEDYGFCHDGFDYDYLYNADGEPAAVVVHDIAWDFSDADDFEDDEEEEEDEITSADGVDDPAPVYTHNEAADIVEMFEDLLITNDLKIPSPEDDERDPDDQLGLYGTPYSELLDAIEERIIKIAARIANGASVVPYEFE